jgi:nucleoside-diphosphate-sugar epimerase
LAGRRVLVTGASGFLGQHVCLAVRRSRADLHVAVRDVAHLPRREQYQGVWALDVRDLARMRRVVTDVSPHVMFHLAGFASAAPSLDLVLPMLEHNLLGTVHALLAAAEAGCERIVLVCSAEELRGAAGTVTSPYGAAKTAATVYARFFERVAGLPVVLTRPMVAYGPRQNQTKLVPYVVTSLLRNEVPRLSSGSRVCDFVYVDDVVRGLLLAATGANLSGQMLELGSGRATRVRDLVDRVVELVGATADPAYGALADRPEEPMEPADLAATYRLVGWAPEWSLDQGLLATIAHYRRLMNTASGAPDTREECEDKEREDDLRAHAG